MFSSFFGVSLRPETRLIYIAIKPGRARWELWPTMKSVNDRIQKRCESESKEIFADIAPVTLGEDGKPRQDVFEDDGLHLNEKGYEVWSQALAPLIEEVLQDVR